MSRRRLIPALSALILALGVAVPALAQTDFNGQTASGAYFSIRVPDGWQPADGLVIWNHGFDFDDPEPNPDLGPLADLQLSEGFAVAASSYRMNGWALFGTLQDNQQMVAAFVDEFGEPDQVFIYGASLGGIVTAQAIEGGGLGNVVGAMPICGALSGSRVWNGALDLRLLYDAICGDVPGAAIPGGALGLTDPTFTVEAMAGAVHACTGILAPPEGRSAEQADNLARLLATTGLPENFVLTDMGFAVFGIADLIFDPRKMGGLFPFANAAVDYGDAGANGSIARVQADPAALDRLLANYTPKGRIGDTKIVSIHTDKDGLVLLENESEYASIVPPENFSLGVVVEDVPSHCGFTEAETVAAWEALRSWVAGIPQPSAADLQDICNAIVAGGLADGPCRIDPGFQVPDLNGRVRPRVACDGGNGSLCLGGRFRVEATWEDFDGNTGAARSGGVGTPDTGTFYFFNPENLELMVKVLDGRQQNGRFWVFYGSLTNVGFEMTVTDSETGQARFFGNAPGQFQSVGNTTAF